MYVYYMSFKMAITKTRTMLLDNVKQDMNKIENIIRRSSVFVSEKKTVRELSEQYSNVIGGDKEDWIRQNKKLCGMFGSPDKVVPLYTEFNIPSQLVVEANGIFFKSLSCK
jgi:hypothetical protein